jgi:hypothetical protein
LGLLNECCRGACSFVVLAVRYPANAKIQVPLPDWLRAANDASMLAIHPSIACS